jgi:Glycosyl hydrolase family 47
MQQRPNGTYSALVATAAAPNSGPSPSIQASIHRRRGTSKSSGASFCTTTSGGKKSWWLPPRWIAVVTTAAVVVSVAALVFLIETITTPSKVNLQHHHHHRTTNKHGGGGMVGDTVASAAASTSTGGVDASWLRRRRRERHELAARLERTAAAQAQERQRQVVQSSHSVSPPPLSRAVLNRLGGDYPYPLIPVEETYDFTNFVVQGGSRYTEYTTGTSPYVISEATKLKSDTVARPRRYHVQQAMKFAWDGYVKHAFGMDEIKPQSGTGSNHWGGRGVTLVDALDTLWLMDLKNEFWHARDWVRDRLDYATVTTGAVSVFETTIRDLGGLLSAYDWSGDAVFLERATDLGERLLHSFDGSTTGLPFAQVFLQRPDQASNPSATNPAILAEFGTIQLELRYLAQATGRPDFSAKADHVFAIMHKLAPSNGLYPIKFHSPSEGSEPRTLDDKFSFGAMGDSFYEYMLKLWIQGGKTEPMYRAMYDKAIDGMHNELLQKSTPSALTYIADQTNGQLEFKMDHLACFMGGLLALGAYTDPTGLDSARAQRDLQTAKALSYTCYQMYARMTTGIAAEFVRFELGRDLEAAWDAPHYLLRPEAVESFFILNYLTGDPIYREWGWEVFLAIEKHCKTKFAYGALPDVMDESSTPRDSMESFFLAETLKYLYLLQDPDTEVNILEKHVFNTEAHPMKILKAAAAAGATNKVTQ